VTAAVRRPPGRPLDAALGDRLLDAGIRLLATHGMHAFRVDNLVAEVHAGKAGFYRRWPTVDHYFAGLARYIARRPVDYTGTEGSIAANLTALVQHQVAGDHGAAATALLSRLPYSEVLHDAWVEEGPPEQLAIETAAIVARSPVLSQWDIPLGARLAELVDVLRVARLQDGQHKVRPQRHVRDRVDEVIELVQSWARQALR